MRVLFITIKKVTTHHTRHAFKKLSVDTLTQPTGRTYFPPMLQMSTFFIF